MQSVKMKYFSFSLLFVLKGSKAWGSFATSSHYENTRLVVETDSPFQPVNISKVYSSAIATISCGTLCAKNSSCWGFNLYPTSTHHVCEFLLENFCANRQRIALQILKGGRVWDKLSPGLTKACIDQKFENTNATNYCGIGRPGCELNITSNKLYICQNCVGSCRGCAGIYQRHTADFNCTTWPYGPTQPPIFAFCKGFSQYLAKRTVDLTNGIVSSNYQMSLADMHRISAKNAYNTLTFEFRSNTTVYVANYADFYIDTDGSLNNLTFTSGNGGDGLNVGNQALAASPWVEGDATCGSFWLLNATQPAATTQCPGGGVSIFGSVNVNNASKQTGLRWPMATAENKILDSGEIRMNP